MLKFMFVGCFFKFLRLMLFEFIRCEVRVMNLTIKKERESIQYIEINTLKSCIKIKLILIFFIMIFMYVLLLSYLIIIF
jgi:hypothetical protein